MSRIVPGATQTFPPFPPPPVSMEDANKTVREISLLCTSFIFNLTYSLEYYPPSFSLFLLPLPFFFLTTNRSITRFELNGFSLGVCARNVTRDQCDGKMAVYFLFLNFNSKKMNISFRRERKLPLVQPPSTLFSSKNLILNMY